MTLTLTTKAGKPAKYANLRLGTDVTPFGHEANNHEQKWNCFPNEEYAVIRARKNKGGYWKSAYGKHYLAANPIKHYDYNF